MDVYSAIRKRSSCRVFTTQALTDTQIKEILDAARYAPSPKNRQPWRFLILRKKQKEEFWEMVSYVLSDSPSAKISEEKLKEINSEKESCRIMEEADTIILVFNAYPSYEILGEKNDLFDCTNIQAIGAAIQNMLLRATELGIGSLWICDIFSCYQELCDRYYTEGQLIAAVALGYSSDLKTRTPRKSIEELLIKENNFDKKNYIWVGPRESDIYDCENLFQGSITIFGANQNDNISYCTEKHIRVDHNVTDCIDNTFWNNKIKQMKEKYPNASLLYYNSEFSFSLPENLRKDVVCCNSQSTLKMLKDKINMRMIFSNLVPVVPFQTIEYNADNNISVLFPNASKLVFQENNSSGGIGTHIVNNDQNADIEKFKGKTFMISPYFEKSIPVNIHLIISNDTILYFPGSVQIMHELDNKIIYLGADYITFQNLHNSEKEKTKKYSVIIGKYLQKIGYKGIVGLDFLITKEEIMFVEINARFQASTPLLNIALKKNKLPSMQEMHITSFTDKKLPEQTLLDTLVVNNSMISYLDGTWNKSYSLLKNNCWIKEIDTVFEDGFSEYDTIQKNSYLFKIIFNTNCTSINPDYCVDIYENLFDIENDFSNAIMNKGKLEIKISLLNQGVLISETGQKHIENLGNIREAVFSAVDLTIFDSMHINCPKNLKFNAFTPWKIDLNQNNCLTLFYHDTEISNVTLDMEDLFCHNIIKPNIKFSDVCFWATDRLRIHHCLSCHLKKQGVGCKFCEVPASKASISIDEILEVVDFYQKNANDFRHFLIGGGSEPRESEYKSIMRIAKHIRQKSSKDIYVMSLPPTDINVLKYYFETGITEIGFNIEIFDPEYALKYMPEKGKIPRQEYFSALKEAVKYWGNTGNVRSLIIVGLESKESLLNGLRKLCEIGVMPILSVFRPIPGTSTENIVPPSNKFLRDIYKEASAICNEYSLHLGPQCHFCQNNTLSLPF